MKIFVPPIKCQGIKTKLVEWIIENIHKVYYDRWIEPFMGSGVVGFNVKPAKAIFADINPHLIAFYNSIKNNEINPNIVKSFLEKESNNLSKGGQKYYNEVRLRFNKDFEPLDFLFLNRSCFNGMIRFNKHGHFNVPFGHKPNRFSKAYITKIVNQVDYIHKAVSYYDWEFVCSDFRTTLSNIDNNDIIYCDPPYFGRHVDYFDSWNEKDEFELFEILNNHDVKYILSTWHSNKFRDNSELIKYQNNNIMLKDHFYHLGATEKNRNSIKEALVMNFTNDNTINYKPNLAGYQQRLLEVRENYKV